jgi:hypothetical protein
LFFHHPVLPEQKVQIFNFILNLEWQLLKLSSSHFFAHLNEPIFSLNVLKNMFLSLQENVLPRPGKMAKNGGFFKIQSFVD